MSVAELTHHVALALQLALLLALPALTFAALAGLLAGLVQSATAVSDAALSFLPRLLAVCAVLFAGGSWMIAKLVAFTGALWHAL